MQNKVTIAIPTLNRAEYLRIALDSALAQTYTNLEVVVSNNASTDNTANLLASISDPRVRVIEQKTTLGMMENWNACIGAATGKYFLLLSDDDILEPAAIEEMVEVFEDSERRGNKIGFVYCGGTMIDGDGITVSIGEQAPPQESAAEIINAFFNGRRHTWACAILFRREDLAPGYDVRFPLTADAVLWIRIVALYGSVRFVNRRLVRYRVHQNATLKTPIAVWHRENIAMNEFAVDELRKAGNASDAVLKEIRRAVQRLNVLITPYLINKSLSHHKLRALVEYWTYRRTFTSCFGVMELTKGLAVLMLPASFRSRLRRLLLCPEKR